jgi:phosphonate transport system ATP-binding protein
MAFELQGVGLTHGNGFRALQRISIRLGRGERVAVIGPSGAGKTSLIRLLGVTTRPSEGRLNILGSNPWQLPAGELRRLRARIGTIHQAPPIPPRLRVITAILAGRLGQWPAWKALLSLLYPVDIAGAQATLARFDLADRLFDRCDRLSGGQLQRVGIARAFYQEPDLFLADEPVSALDPALADAALGELVAESERRGAGLFASLHAVDLALKWFPRIVGLRAGEVAFDLPTGEVSDGLLHELYAAEGGVLPTQASDPATLRNGGAAVEAIAEGGDGTLAVNVVRLDTCRGR